MHKTWKIGIAVISAGLFAATGVACASATPTPLPPVTVTTTATITATPAVKNLILTSDTVVGSGGAPAPKTSCILQSQYAEGTQVVFRVRVYDPLTGKQMDDKSVPGVTVSLPNGQNLTCSYSGHPATDPTADKFWTNCWVIPADYPTGVLNYTINAKAADGRTGSFDNFRVAASYLTITAGSPAASASATPTATK